nr:pheromone receptor B2 [Pleurotus eryngii]
MADLTYPLYPIFAFLGFFLSLVPLPWHLQAWNSGTCYFMMWSSLACLNQFINSVVWHNNALNPSPIWCEISIRILMGASVGIPAASLCINRRLYHIASIQAVSVSRGEKRRDILIDTGICVVFPIVYIALQYIVQGHRYDILEDLGCQPALYNTLPTYFISYMWPILIGLVSAVYCVLSLRSFIRRRVQFNQFLSSNKSLTAGRYFRLMALAACDLTFTIPLSIFIIWVNTVANPVAPWISWEDTHFGFSRVGQIPAVLWRSNERLVVATEATRWFVPLCGILFFALFGFADEARRSYTKAFWAVVKPFGFAPAPATHGKHFVSIGRFVQPKQPLYTSTGTSSSPSTTDFVAREEKLPHSPITPTSSSYSSTTLTSDLEKGMQYVPIDDQCNYIQQSVAIAI